MQLPQLELGQTTANRLLQESAYGYLMRIDSFSYPSHLNLQWDPSTEKAWKHYLGKVTPGFASNNSNRLDPSLPLTQVFVLSSQNIIFTSLLDQRELPESQLPTQPSASVWGCCSSWGSSPKPGSCWSHRACTRWLLVGLVTSSSCSPKGRVTAATSQQSQP